MMGFLGAVLAVYIILAFLVFLDSDSPKELASLAEGLMWPVTLYQACKDYVKGLK